MALQIRADEWFNHRVYYGFYGVHSEWTPEHEQRPGKKQAQALCAFLSLSLSLLSAVSQANNAERYLKFFAIINFDKKKTKTEKPCAQSIYSQIAVNTDDCVGRRTTVSSCDLAVSEVFGVQAGGGRKV